jgi:ankyrin repeat protein
MSDTRPLLLPLRRLPDQPNLEQLRKQAKDLLHAYRAAESAAVAEVNHFEKIPDAATFALNDAQRILARAYGFASWSKLKAFVDGANAARFLNAAKNGDLALVRSLMASRPELVGMGTSANGEYRAIHYAVMNRDAAMTRLLMEAGADARQGIYPHRDATTALALAQERGFDDVVAVIEQEERHRREDLSCMNATVTPAQDQISAAISSGDRGEAIRLLEADPSQIQACDRNGRTPLHLAAQENDVELVAWLLNRRASPRKLDPHDLAPIDLAALAADPRNDAAEKFPATARLLLSHGSELTIRAAVALGNEPRVRELTAAYPALLQKISTFGGGLVTLAVNHRQIEMVRLLLDLGADVNERTLLAEEEEPQESWGMPLWYAALAGDFALTKLLLDRGADPNANVYASGWPLRNAWNHRDASVKNLLLERGATPKPYMVAEMHDVAEAQRLLEQNPDDEELANELVWSAADHGCPEIVELGLPYLKWPRNDERWNWILMQPIRGGNGDAPTKDGFFASLAAILRAGVDPDVPRFGRTALHYAAARHRSASGKDRAHFAEMLLDHGASVSRRDDLLKSTPLGWACRWGRKEIVELLLERGAPAHEPDAEPWAQPIAWARKMNHPEIVALLERHAQPGEPQRD